MLLACDPPPGKGRARNLFRAAGPYVQFCPVLEFSRVGGDMPHNRAALVIGVVASVCVLLAGCGGSSSCSNSWGSAPGPMKKVTNDTSTSGGGPSGTGARLTGNFCTDFKNIGQSVKIPASAQSDPSALQRHGAQYLTQAATYFRGLAAEAPPQAGKELRVLAA